VRAAAAFGAYLLASLLWFGRPLLNDLDGSVIGAGGIEQSLHIWSLKWWVHAVSVGANPFDADVIYAPDGFNLAWAAAIPGPSALAAPITALFGPVISYNVWAILAPALGAWGAYLLCNQVTRHFWASLAGGYIFGFSSYVLAATTSHLNLTLVVVALPLAVYLFLRHLEGSLPGARFVLLMAGVLVFQFLTFTETFATMTGLAVVALGLAWLFFPERRPALLGTVRLTAVAYALALLVLAPYLYYAFSDPGELAKVNRPEDYPTDPLNLVVPTPLTALGGDSLSSLSERYPGNAAEQYAYVGLPLLVIMGWLLFDPRRTRVAALTLSVAAAAVVASLGTELHLGGSGTGIPMPWWPLAHAPLFKFAIPSRVMVYAWLAIAVAVALWLASARGSVYRWALALLAGASLAPNLGGSFPGGQIPLWHADLFTPPFFERRSYERFVDPGETMLVFPTGPSGLSMLWQAEADMDFDMAGGYISSTTAPGYRCWPIDLYLQFGIEVPNASRELLAFLHAKRTAIAVAPLNALAPAALQKPDPLGSLLGGEPPLLEGGVKVYRVPGAERASRRPHPTCPEESSS
jgi:hypothetical protein